MAFHVALLLLSVEAASTIKVCRHVTRVDFLGFPSKRGETHMFFNCPKLIGFNFKIATYEYCIEGV